MMAVFGSKENTEVECMQVRKRGLPLASTKLDAACLLHEAYSPIAKEMFLLSEAE